MELTQKHIEKIKTAFAKMQTKEDLLRLLNEAKPFVFGENTVAFELKQITWYASKKRKKNFYRKFEIKKKSGGSRPIHAPNKGLKAIQRTIGFVLQCVFEPHKASMGFVKNKSILDNANIHVGNRYVYNIDLKDFFSSIDQARFWKCLQLPPFNLNKDNESSAYSRVDIANIFAVLCFTELEVKRKNSEGTWNNVKKSVLPQGAPTSPVISNIVCKRLDYLLTAVAKRFGLKYSRYADDITFSSMHNVYQSESEFLKELHRIIAEQGFYIKESKTRLQKDGHKKEVTGLLVNEKANVPKRYIKQLRMWLYYWERYGYERAYVFFLQQYTTDKGHTHKGKPDMINVIGGKLDYLKMVRGGECELYLKLKERFELLVQDTKDSVIVDVNFGFIKQEQLPIKTKGALISTKIDSDLTDKIRISINSLDFPKGKLKRDIFYRKGETLPLEKFEDNFEKEEKEIDLSKHKPIDVTRFLLNFRSSEGLKFLTHDYDKTDSVFDYENILEIAKREFDQLSSQFVIPASLWARINQFAFGESSKIWIFNKIHYKTNWKSPDLIKWMKINPNIHPIKNDDFDKKFIAPFKKSIEIKSPELEYIFKNKLAENLGIKYSSFDIQLIDLDKANFYTNVDALLVGISYLFKSIKQRFDNSNKIKVEFLRKSDTEGRKRILKIVHIDSICNKPLDKNELFQGDLLEAEKAFFGICDWSIVSKSPDNSVNQLNILFDINSNKSPKEKIDNSLIEGFTHILTFYS